MMISNLTNRLRSVCESVILPLRSVWKNLAAIYRELEPVRLSVIIVALSALAFLLVPQGTDLLIGLAEDAGRGMRLPSVLGFFSALAYFCLGNWYWPRFLLNCDFARPKRSEHLNVRVAYELRLHTPRILGILPACVIGFAFLSNRAPGQGAYISLGLASFVLAVLLYGAFIARRSFLDRPLHVSKGNSLEHPQKGAKHAGRKSFQTVGDVMQDREAMIGISLFGIPPCILFLIFVFAPVWGGQTLGSPAVVFLGLASLACFGGVIVYFGHRYELPVLGMLLILAFVAHFNNDNHEVRSLPGAQATLEPLDKRLEDWHSYVATKGPPGTKHPLFIVATEGGGIRAAFWTALVLSSLEDDSRAQNQLRFSDHLFAVSGVSGGSFGGAAFVALLADRKEANFAERNDAFMKHEFLAPLVGRLLFTDVVGRPVAGRRAADHCHSKWCGCPTAHRRPKSAAHGNAPRESRSQRVARAAGHPLEHEDGPCGSLPWRTGKATDPCRHPGPASKRRCEWE